MKSELYMRYLTYLIDCCFITQWLPVSDESIVVVKGDVAFVTRLSHVRCVHIRSLPSYRGRKVCPFYTWTKCVYACNRAELPCV